MFKPWSQIGNSMFWKHFRASVFNDKTKFIIIIIIIIIIIMVYFKIIALESELWNYLHLKTNNVKKNTHWAFLYYKRFPNYYNLI